MNALRRWLFHPALWQGLVLLAFAVVFWFAGPLVAVSDWRPLEGGLARAALIGAAVLAVALHWTWRWRHRERPPAGSVALPRQWGAWIYGAIGVVCAGALAAWGTSYVHNSARISTVAASVDALGAKLRAMRPVASDDVAGLLPILQTVRDLASAAPGDASSSGTGFGLSQDRRLAAAVQRTYRRLLRETLWPPLAMRVEQLVRQDTDDAELQYESLKAYLMLFDPVHFDAAALGSFIDADWQARQQRQPADLDALREHLVAMLADGPPAVQFKFDETLVAKLRARLSVKPLPERVYGRLKRLGVGAEIASFTVLRAAGPAAATAFVRESGAPLSQGVPGLFTRDGYHRGFQRAIEGIANQLADEQPWVLGVAARQEDGSPRSAPAMLRLLEDVRRLYLVDYARVWEAYMVDLRLAPTRNLPALVDLVRTLSSPDGPLQPLLRAMSRETTLADADTPLARATDRARGMILGAGTDSATPPARIESVVDDRFEGLRRLVTRPDDRTPSPLDRAMTMVDDLYLWLFTLQRSGPAENSPYRPDPVLPLRAESYRLAEPLRSMLNDLAARSESLGGATVKRR